MIIRLPANSGAIWLPEYTGAVQRAVDALQLAVDAVQPAYRASGSVTQATSKATAVTLDTVMGDITCNAAALAAGTIVSFTLNNAQIAAADLVWAVHQSGGTIGAYTVNARSTGAGTAQITLRNNTGGSLSEAVVVRFGIIKGA